MEIGILSMCQVDNYGSILQGYVLKKLLNEKGHTVRFLNISGSINDNELMKGYQKEYSFEIKENSIFSKIDRYFFNRVHNRLITKKQKMIFDKFRQEKLGFAEESDSYYDLCIIGSDEVFNCQQISPWGFTGMLFGDIKNANKVISYAASCGFTCYDDLPNKVKERIERSFKNFEGVSVRDANTYEFASHFTNKKVYLHLDPVLIGDFKTELSGVALPFDEHVPYCVVYSYGNRIHNKSEIEHIKAFCKKKKMRIISIYGGQKWINRFYALDPFQVLKCIKKAELVITDTFHGTIFSYMFANRFAVNIVGSNYNKLHDLVNRLSISEHVVDCYKDLERTYEIVRNMDEVDKRLLLDRERTMEYLDQFI